MAMFLMFFGGGGGGGVLRLTLFCVGCGGIAVLVNNVLGRRKCIVA